MSHECKPPKLKIYYQLIEGLRTTAKQEKLLKLLKDVEFDLIIFLDTHLSGDIVKINFLDENFEVIRKDLNDKFGGILIVYPKNSSIISHELRHDFDSKTHEIEELWITLTLKNDLKLNLCTVHMQANCKKENFEKYFEQLRRNLNNHTHKFLTVGNFNFDDFYKFKCKLIKMRKHGTKLDIMNKSTKGLRQINKIQNCEGEEMLDMVFTNTVNTTVEKSNFELVKAKYKHPPLEIEVKIEKPHDVENNRNAKLENEIERLKKSFESFKVSHDEEIKALRNEIRILRGILEDEGML